jgi:hypothetical protein
MNCPKCGKELINVNGKYVCVDCGIEVPENEATQNSGTGVPTEPTPVETKPVDVTPAPLPVESVDPVPSQSTPPAETGEPKIADMTSEENPVSIEPMVATLDTSMPISEIQPKDVSPAPEMPSPVSEITEPTSTPPGESVSIPVTKLSDNAHTVPPVDTIATSAETPVVPEPMQPVEPEVAPTQESVPAPASVAVDPFDQAEKTVSPISQGTISPTEPMQTTPSMNPVPPIQPDPAIFQDPMYDNNPTETTQVPDTTPFGQVSQQTAQVQNAQPGDDTKKLKIILFLGIGLAVVLLVCGVAAFFLLT